jgi:transcriptional regulator with XRE-family HTH domain
VATAEQRSAFREALQQALDDARMSARGLARALGMSPASVSKWIREKTTPAPDTVARAEKLLEVEPGTLSRPLGYVVIDEPGDMRPSSVAEAAKSDPRLGPRERAVLLAVYRELVRQYANAVRKAVEPGD